MAKQQSKPEDLNEDQVKAHLEAAQGAGDPQGGDPQGGDPQGGEPQGDPKDGAETQPSVVADEKYYRCKAPTTYMKDHGTGIVYDGGPKKSPLTGFLQSQIAAGKMEECDSPE